MYKIQKLSEKGKLKAILFPFYQQYGITIENFARYLEYHEPYCSLEKTEDGYALCRFGSEYSMPDFSDATKSSDFERIVCATVDGDGCHQSSVSELLESFVFLSAKYGDVGIRFADIDDKLYEKDTGTNEGKGDSVQKYYRWMSYREFGLYTSGAEIVGKTEREEKTTSSGVCFLPENVVMEIYENKYHSEETVHLQPEDCISFLDGIVTDDILVEFEAKESLLTDSKGVYANPFTDNFQDNVIVHECCTPSYSKDTFAAKRYLVSDVAEAERHSIRADVDSYSDPVWMDYDDGSALDKVEGSIEEAVDLGSFCEELGISKDTGDGVSWDCIEDKADGPERYEASEEHEDDMEDQYETTDYCCID